MSISFSYIDLFDFFFFYNTHTGRAGQMRSMLKYAVQYGRTFRDDQLMFVRYMIEHPDIVAIDTGNRIFATNFKMKSAPGDLKMTFDLTLTQSNAPVGLLHCNNKASGSSYEIMASALFSFEQSFYKGESWYLSE